MVLIDATERRGQFVNYYSALGVPESASFRDIEAAYWRQAMRNREALPLLNQAYEVLGHAERATALKHAAEAAVRVEQLPASTPAARPPRRSLHEFLG